MSITSDSFKEKWPVGALVIHDELQLKGRIIGNAITLGHSEVPALEVHFYILDPPDIKYTTVIPSEVRRLNGRAKG